MRVFLIAGLLLSVSARASFLPQTETFIEDPSLGESQISETLFKERIKEFQDAYAPVVKQFRGRLSIKGQWKSKRINAYASQSFGSWNVIITGALARRPELTADGMSLIVCHEIGHHLGGFPFSKGNPLGGRWASVEGQSDYYSTFVCAKKLWADEVAANAEFRMKVVARPRLLCDANYSADVDRDLCYRSSVALESVIATMAGILKKPMPKYETPDLSVVDATREGHPATQCRFDTLFAGAICPVKTDERIIPGKKTKEGRRSGEAEKEAALHSCSMLMNFTTGLRPACWFKATM